jgi:hypothetical protein
VGGRLLASDPLLLSVSNFRQRIKKRAQRLTAIPQQVAIHPVGCIRAYPGRVMWTCIESSHWEELGFSGVQIVTLELWRFILKAMRNKRSGWFHPLASTG